MKINILSFIISLGLGLIFMPKLRAMLLTTSLLESNYKGDLIPNGMGLGIIFAQLINIVILIVFGEFFKIKEVYLNSSYYLVGFIFIGLLGLLDDTIGTDEYKGFKGHIGAFFKGKLTTGNIKAFLGFLIALYVSFYISRDIMEMIINTFLISLFTNLMNLFDLRPGRAIKVFIIISFLNIIISKNLVDTYIISSLYGILLSYIKYDLKALAMMGDTGSNILGYSLGYYAAVNFSVIGKLIIIGILIFTNLLSEKKSFSKIIEGNKILSYIDKLGR